jgi:hypothetical protein
MKVMQNLIQTFELAQSSAAKRALYVRSILFSLTVILIIKTASFFNLGYEGSHRSPSDFDIFYIVGQMVLHGNIEQAYNPATMHQIQETLIGRGLFLPWAYPPQFDLLLAPLALLPLGVAYGLFTAGTLVIYLAITKLIAGECFALLWLALFPVIAITTASGQNGFLTGTLIGLTCLGMQTRNSLAGLPLGLLIIKPHLGIAFAVYALVTRRWGVVLVAATTVAATSAIATLILGPQVWPAFFRSLQGISLSLEHGEYPFFRMISFFATLRTFGLSAGVAIAGQLVSAAFALSVMCLGVRRGFETRQSLGLTAIATLLISPYSWDYDLPILGIGIALLLPTLMRLGSGREKVAIFGLTLFTSMYSLVQAGRLSIQYGSNLAMMADDHLALSVVGLTLAAILWLFWRILQNDNARRASAQHLHAPDTTSV